MRFIVEFEGVIVDVRKTWYAAYRQAVEAVGWSHVDEGTYWRLTRRGETESKLLQGAGPNKFKAFTLEFDRLIESQETIEQYTVSQETLALVKQLGQHGDIIAVSLGANVEARRKVATPFLPDVESLEQINADPRRRPAELKVLSANDPRTIVAATNGSLLRATGAASLFGAGLSCGPCGVRRLHQAGADIVLGDFGELVDALEKGAPALVSAGLLPPSLDAGQ